MHRTVSPASTLIVAVRVWVSPTESASGKPEASLTQERPLSEKWSGGALSVTVYSPGKTIANVRELLWASENSPRSPVKEKEPLAQ